MSLTHCWVRTGGSWGQGRPGLKKKGGGGRLTEEDTQCQPLAPKVHVPMSVSAHTHKGNAKYNNSYTKLFYTDISF